MMSCEEAICTTSIGTQDVQEVEHQDSHWVPQNATTLQGHLQGNICRRQWTPVQTRRGEGESIALQGELGDQHEL